MRIDSVKFVSELRRRDMTQKQLSEVSGVSRATINGVVAGRKCSVATANKIATALNVKLEELI